MNLQKTILAAGAILMAVFILTLGSSCSHSKDLFKTETTTKSETRIDDSLKIETLKNEVAELSRQIREMENQEFVFQECPSIDSVALRNSIIEVFKRDTSRLNQKIDSLIAAMNKKPANSTYKKDKDGNTEITGPLKSVKTSKIREEQMTLKYTSIIQSLIESHIRTAATVLTKTEQKEKHSKGGFLNLPWLWIILAVLVGMYLGWRLRGGIKLIDKLNPTNMKNLILVFFASLLLTSCGKSPEPDNKISARSARQTGWTPVDRFTDPVPIIDSFYYLEPTGKQAALYASQRGDHSTWNVIGFILIGLGVFWFMGISDKIRWFPAFSSMVKGIGSFVLLAAIGISFTWQYMSVKYRNKKEISKTRYEELMQRDGSTRAFWDSLNNGCHIVGGKYDCWDKDKKRIK